MNLGLSPEALIERRKGVGGSDAKRIMDGDWLPLWQEKTGRVESEDLSNNLAVQMGSFTEALNAHWYTKQTGREITHRSDLLVSPKAPWMRANLDGLTVTGRGRRAYWDAKHVGRLDTATVLRYTPQMVHCCQVLCDNGLLTEDWVLSVFIGNSKWEIVEQEVDPFYAEELIAKEREFWGYVERDEEPPRPAAAPPPPPAPKLKTVHLDGDPQAEHGTPAWHMAQAWPNWAGEAIDLIDKFIGTEKAAKLHAIVREDLKKLVPEDVGELTYGGFTLKRSRVGAVTMTGGK